MKSKITRNHFSTEAEALVEIAEAKYFPLTIDVPAEKNDVHWHDFDTMLFMLDGALTATEAESGETFTVTKGDRVVATNGILHHENHNGFKAVFGFSADPSTFTMPINKPPLDA